jgi:hypothetical protein
MSATILDVDLEDSSMHDIVELLNEALKIDIVVINTRRGDYILTKNDFEQLQLTSDYHTLTTKFINYCTYLFFNKRFWICDTSIISNCIYRDDPVNNSFICYVNNI